ncbi:acyltransferase family protein [Novipirellula galeiformis]|nr:acyltransferase [Novipirellula galeiformis]
MTLVKQPGAIPSGAHHFATLDWVRGFAALWVFAFHYSFSTRFVETFPRLHEFFQLGHLGVPIFFVVSGFCIASAVAGTRRRGSGVRDFAWRRFRRIYPTFWFSIGVVISIPLVMEMLSFFKSGEFASLDPEVTSNGWLSYGVVDWLGLVTLTKVFSPDEGIRALHVKFNTINAVYWTLAIEVQFYMVAAIAVFKRVSFPWLIVLVTCVSGIFLNQFPHDRSGLFLPYWPMFAAGTLLYFVVDRGWDATRMMGRWPRLVLLCGLPLLMFALNQHSFLFCGVCAVWLWVLKSFDARLGSLQGATSLPIRAMAFMMGLLGAMSYSVYLIHQRVQYLSAQIAWQVFAPESIAFDLLVILITLLFCFGFYLVAERPFVRSSRSPLANKRANGLSEREQVDPLNTPVVPAAN